MEGALVFATTAGIGYMVLKDQYQSMLSNGGSLVGVNELVRAQMPNQPVYTRSQFLQNFQDPNDYTEGWRGQHQKFIDSAHLDYTHPVLDPFKFAGRQSVGPAQDTNIHSMLAWVQ